MTTINGHRPALLFPDSKAANEVRDIKNKSDRVRAAHDLLPDLAVPELLDWLSEIGANPAPQDNAVPIGKGWAYSALKGRTPRTGDTGELPKLTPDVLAEIDAAKAADAEDAAKPEVADDSMIIGEEASGRVLDAFRRHRTGDPGFDGKLLDALRDAEADTGRRPDVETPEPEAPAGVATPAAPPAPVVAPAAVDVETPAPAPATPEPAPAPAVETPEPPRRYVPRGKGVGVLLVVAALMLAGVIIAPIALSSQDIIDWAGAPTGLGLRRPWDVITFASLDMAAFVCVCLTIYCVWRGESAGMFGVLVWAFAGVSAFANYRHGSIEGAAPDAWWFFPAMSLAGPALLELVLRRVRKWIQEGTGKRARHGVSFGVLRWVPGVGALRETYGAWRLARLDGLDSADQAVTAYRRLCPTGSIRILKALRARDAAAV